MLKSMTAYGRSCVSIPLGCFTVEIQSVNRKFLEMTILHPKELKYFDPEIRKQVSHSVFRGHVTIHLTVFLEKESLVKVRPNLALAHQIKTAWSQILSELKLKDKQEAHIQLLLAQEGLFLYEDEFKKEEVADVLKQAITLALEQLMDMKVKEGLNLQRDIENRLKILQQAMQVIALEAPHATERYRQKLSERLEQILPGTIENEERILREIALFAEKIDISEEITRFHSHLEQFQALLVTPKECIGKTLEFLVQELNREANTIGSKTNSLVVTKEIIEIKSELEKVKEQLQNVE